MSLNDIDTLADKILREQIKEKIILENMENSDSDYDYDYGNFGGCYCDCMQGSGDVGGMQGSGDVGGNLGGMRLKNPALYKKLMKPCRAEYEKYKRDKLKGKKKKTLGGALPKEYLKGRNKPRFPLVKKRLEKPCKDAYRARVNLSKSATPVIALKDLRLIAKEADKSLSVSKMNYQDVVKELKKLARKKNPVAVEALENVNDGLYRFRLPTTKGKVKRGAGYYY
jgi:hypothetical protein